MKKTKSTKNMKNNKTAVKASACSMCCPVTGAKVWNLMLSTLGCFAFIFAFGYVVHGNLLMPMYLHTKHLWRSAAEMDDYSLFLIATQVVTAFVVSGLYSKYWGGCGVMRGVRFGLLIGLLMGTMSAAAFAWMPITVELAQAWFIAGIVEGLGLGLICWAAFKSCESTEMCKM